MNKCAKRNDLEAKIETLEENNKSLNTLVKKSMGTFKYVNAHYPNAPSIAKLTNKKINLCLNHYLIIQVRRMIKKKKSLKVGEFINILNSKGNIIKITLLETQIKTKEGDIIHIPNVLIK